MVKADIVKPKINIINKKRRAGRYSATFMRLKRKFMARHIWFVRGFFILIGVIIAFLMIIVIFKAVENTTFGKYLSLAKTAAFPKRGSVLTLDNRTNILILGKAGEGYTAPDLTDTIMVASIKHGTNNDQIDLVSLPRDIWVEDLKAKLNSAYYWGEQKQKGGGKVLAKATVEEIVGVPIHYAVVIDFDHFKDFIDYIGGIDVDVQKGFVDERFPIKGKENDECGGNDPEYLCRYETITFEKGLIHMDGETALKYVRSRQSQDLEEGTDFARASRQQQVLTAVQNKIISREIIFSPKKLLNLYDEGLSIIETDLSEKQLAVIARYSWDAKGSVTSHVLPEEFLVNPPISRKYDNLYVFIPEGEDWIKVQEWFKQILFGEDAL